MQRVVVIACCFHFLSACTSAAPEFVLAPVEGGEIAYVARGDGEAVLLLHGGLIGLSSYQAVMAEPALADYRLIRYARRGYPPSSGHSGPTSLAQQAVDAAALLTHLGIERAHVVAHSAGGPIAVQLAVDRPDLVQSLTLLEGGPLSTPASAPALAAGPSGEPPAFVLSALAGNYDAAASGFMEFLYGPGWRAEDEIASSGNLEEITRTVPMFFQTELAMYGAPVASDYYSRVAAPTAVVIGELSVGTDIGVSSLVALELLPHAERIDLPAADHAMLTRKPREVAEVIAAFVARHPR